MGSNTKISVKNLNLYYGEKHALKDVSMEIKEKAITAFIGPSGCGKSTFLKTLNRMNNLVDGVKIAGTVEIDHLQKKIEGICFNLLIQQQPVARDLRNVTAAMKMVTDMERIGDHAADISEMTILMGQGSQIDKFEHISKMATETMIMLNHSIEAYVEKDVIKAKEVIEHDDVVDDLFVEAKKDVIKLILNNPGEGEEATDILMIAKYFERIGDHATNIAEWVIFSLKQKEDADEV